MCSIVGITTFAALICANLKCSSSQYDQTSGVSSAYGIPLQIQPDAIAFPTSVDSKSNYYQHHHNYHNFQHSRDFHQNHDFHHHHDHYPHDHGGGAESVEENSQESSNEIPLALMLQYNNYTDVNDLLLNLVEGDIEEDNGEPLLASRFGGGVERSAATTVPKAANCMPELQTVKIATNDDPSVLFIPSCTRIERCGGCCSHSLLSCQPTKTETVSYQVVKTQFTGGSKLKFMGKEVVLVEKHIKCKCDCKVQEKDCNSFQEYSPAECRCACVNTDEEKKCYKDNATKLWNPETCACQCRNIYQCSTGYTFDTIRCKCTPTLVRRFAENPEEPERKGYKSEALPVLPLKEAEHFKP